MPLISFLAELNTDTTLIMVNMKSQAATGYFA